MSQVAVEVEGLSKRYRIGSDALWYGRMSESLWRTSGFLAESHSTTWSSRLAEARPRPSGLNATAVTSSRWPVSVVRAVADAVNIPVVASGGAGNPEHLRTILTEGHASAALAASIFHYGTHPIDETKRYLANHGVPIRFNTLGVGSPV